MCIISIENNIYLLGGYDNEDVYQDIYQLNLSSEEQIEIKLNPNLSLPNKCNFNSNYIFINNENDENNNEHQSKNRILIMDNLNGVIVFDWITGNFNYYLE